MTTSFDHTSVPINFATNLGSLTNECMMRCVHISGCLRNHCVRTKQLLLWQHGRFAQMSAWPHDKPCVCLFLEIRNRSIKTQSRKPGSSSGRILSARQNVKLSCMLMCYYRHKEPKPSMLCASEVKALKSNQKKGTYAMYQNHIL